MHGCAEACDEALVECFKRTSSACSGSSTSTPTSPLAPVLELYSCRHLLPSPEDDPRVRAVVEACCKCLTQHWDAGLPAGPDCSTQPSKVQLLSWLLGGGDAVRIANDTQLLQLWQELPVGALEELLRSDHLSTDDEATVVLLVEMWVAAKGSAVTEADKARVRRQLRLVNCSTSYLFDVLPKLPWMGAEEAAFLARCRMSDPSTWRHMGQNSRYDTSSPWYGKPRPQSVPKQGLSYRWEVSREDLLAGLRKEGRAKKLVYALHQVGGGKGCSSDSVTALGFLWAMCLWHTAPNPHAGVHVRCSVPPAILAQTGRLHGGGGGCLSARVAVWRGAGACGRKLPLRDIVVSYRGRMGCNAVLELAAVAEPALVEQQQGQGQQQEAAGGQAGGGRAADSDAALLAPWSKLLEPDGKIRGDLKFYRMGAGQVQQQGGKQK